MTWLWLGWVGFVVLSFGALEGYALRHSERMWTLSRAVASMGEQFPLTLVIFGALFGGLSVHFFWHFCL